MKQILGDPQVHQMNVDTVIALDSKLGLVERVISQSRLHQQVKRALIMMHQDYPRFFEELESNSRLQVQREWRGVKCSWNLPKSTSKNKLWRC